MKFGRGCRGKAAKSRSRKPNPATAGDLKPSGISRRLFCWKRVKKQGVAVPFGNEWCYANCVELVKNSFGDGDD
jgi:hypothetical protein